MIPVTVKEEGVMSGRRAWEGGGGSRLHGRKEAGGWEEEGDSEGDLLYVPSPLSCSNRIEHFL